jgi:hypothetical chaperone protein
LAPESLPYRPCGPKPQAPSASCPSRTTFSIGIDFGTSNTVVALADSHGNVEALTFDHRGQSLKVYVTALCFWDERHGNGLRTRVEGGPWAIDQFLEGLEAHRFIQSFKTFAASATFRRPASSGSAIASRTC